VTKSLWDEHDIESSLRTHLNLHHVEDEVVRKVDEDDVEGVRQWFNHRKDAKAKASALLLWASWRGASSCAASLVDDLGAEAAGSDGNGRSCLHLAAVAGRLDAAKVLLARGAKVNAFDRHRLATPLFCAAVASDDSAGIDLLLARGADINAGLHELGVSALHCAVRANAVQNVRVLLEKGAIPNSVQLFSETPLHTAAAMGYDECVRLLIEHGACLEVSSFE